MALDTLDDLKLGLGVTGTADDALLARLLDHAAGHVRAHCGRAFDGGTFTEFHPAGRITLFLRNYPIDAVTGLRVDPNRAFGSETERPVGSYIVLADRGLIVCRTGPFLPPNFESGAGDWPNAVRVAYTVPAAVPAPVREAVTQLVGSWYRQVKTNVAAGQQLLLERTDAGGTSAYSWGLTAGLKVPAGVYQLLEAYRVPAM